MPWIPIAVLEFIIFPLYPYLDVPPIAFEAWVAGDTAEISDNISEKDKQLLEEKGIPLPDEPYNDDFTK